MVELDDVVVLDHLLDQVGAEIGQPAGVALRSRPVDRQRASVQQRGHRPVEQRPPSGPRRERDLLGILGCRGARLQVPEAAGLEAVAGVDHDPEVAGDHLGAAERVVELVDREERADAEVVELLQPGIDLRLVALRDAVDLTASEDPRHLDPLDHRELALVDHAPGLERDR